MNQTAPAGPFSKSHRSDSQAGNLSEVAETVQFGQDCADERYRRLSHRSAPPSWQRSQDRDFRSDHSLDIGVKTCSWVYTKKIKYIITFKNLFKQLTRMGGKKAPFIILHKIGPLLVLHTGIGHGQSAALRVWSGFKESGAGNQKAIQRFNEDLSLWILVKVIAFHHRDMSLVFVQVTVDLGDQQLLGSQLLSPSGYQRHLKHNNKNKRTKNKV